MRKVPQEHPHSQQFPTGLGNAHAQREKEEDLASAELRHQQLLDLQCGCETTIFATYDNVMEDASPLLVRVLAKSWEETDLQALVENAAVKAGVQPLYPEVAEEE
ncbi:hypothetical protein BTJ68_08235 [Hortaea werneckii EXF-2000]|uniref:Uncharacterized protein n=1 Tax=Hortaea werneckii EXF-2000 TaxID=1157616 RepID=A0A1Z5T625_HORWE|nr:hypothetical protein BTJ68_08235 [Hortaea werneckii EXF-2000]